MSILRTDGMAWTGTYPCGCVGALTIAGHDEAEAAHHMQIRPPVTVQLVPMRTARGLLTLNCEHTPKWGGVADEVDA
jgi:hypothetical protein